MDVTPTNEVERGFTIGVVVFALVTWLQSNQESSPSSFLFHWSRVSCAEVGFAYVVGSITASLAQLRTMSEEAGKT